LASHSTATREFIVHDFETEVRGDQRTQLVNNHSWQIASEDIPGLDRGIDPTLSIIATQPQTGTLEFWDVADRQVRP